jgi:hypothetical protein
MLRERPYIQFHRQEISYTLFPIHHLYETLSKMAQRYRPDLYSGDTQFGRDTDYSPQSPHTNAETVHLTRLVQR